MTDHLIVPPTAPPSQPGAAGNPMPRLLDRHRRTQFAQRLAVLIQRRRAVAAATRQEEAADEH